MGLPEFGNADALLVAFRGFPLGCQTCVGVCPAADFPNRTHGGRGHSEGPARISMTTCHQGNGIADCELHCRRCLASRPSANPLRRLPRPLINPLWEALDALDGPSSEATQTMATPGDSSR